MDRSIYKHRFLGFFSTYNSNGKKNRKGIFPPSRPYLTRSGSKMRSPQFRSVVRTWYLTTSVWKLNLTHFRSAKPIPTDVDSILTMRKKSMFSTRCGGQDTAGRKISLSLPARPGLATGLNYLCGKSVQKRLFWLTRYVASDKILY